MKNLFASPKALWSGLIVLMLLLAACGTPTEAPAAEALAEAATAEEGNTGGESGAAPAGGGGAASGGDLCANDYMPVVEGASWAYSGTSFEGPYSWVQSVSGVSGGGFTITNTFDGGDTAVVVHQWSCTPEGLAALDYGSGPEGSVGTSGIQADYSDSGLCYKRDKPAERRQRGRQLDANLHPGRRHGHGGWAQRPEQRHRHLQLQRSRY
ncbi:MAG: hypothetical protein KIS85_09160 [Anaerolineales bacterium]|nr:hypothetical protein [Anaerolineales bacterium]